MYQTNSTELGDHILVFDDEGVYVRKVFVPKSEFRAKQVDIGKDFQILSIAEFKELYG